MTFSLGKSPGGEQRSEAGKSSNGFELGHDSGRIWCNFVQIIYRYNSNARFSRQIHQEGLSVLNDFSSKTEICKARVFFLVFSGLGCWCFCWIQSPE